MKTKHQSITAYALLLIKVFYLYLKESSKVAHRLKTLFLESGVARVLVVFKNEQLKIYLWTEMSCAIWRDLLAAFSMNYTYNDVNHVVVIINDIILRILRTCFSLTGVSWLLIALLMATVCRKKKTQSC